MSMKPPDQEESRLIEEAVKRGIVQKYPTGHTSGWDDKPFREKRSILLARFKARHVDRK